MRSIGTYVLLVAAGLDNLDDESSDVRYTPGAVMQLPYLRLHEAVYRASRGFLGRHVGGRPALLLTTTGRRSGLRRVNALIYASRGEDLVVIGSNGGSDRHPGWYWNITDNPHVEVQIGRQRFDATARVAEASERDELWALANRKNRGLAPVLHPGAAGRYEVYARHTTRKIPVVVLTPTVSEGQSGAPATPSRDEIRPSSTDAE